jgi:predicted ATP-binding protein involved in virulence
LNIRNEVKNVKITKLLVKGLHGRYDYNVEFNEDLTFLFGANGSGKTTILDMLSSVITGELYRLFNYEFDSLELYYLDENTGEEIIKIKLNITVDSSFIDCTFKDNSHSIQLADQRNDISYGQQSLRTRYFRAHSILREIENLFPFIYLPLNRKGGNSRKDIRYRSDLKETYLLKNGEEVAYDVDIALLEAKNKIVDSQHTVNQKKQALDRKFRDDLFKSLITMKNRDIWSELTEIKAEQLETLLNDYTQAINNMKILNENEFKKFTTDNETLVKNVNMYIDENKEALNADLAVSFYRVWQASEIIELTKVLQDSIEKEDNKLNSFVKTINSFFGDGEDAVTKKSIYWSAGKISFRNDWDTEDVELAYLSSGEKQLFIFFAHLIFSLEDNQPGILVVDEPELSLHLAWQREYVNKIIELNPNVQIIFATHAPELVGRYTTKMVKLCPTLSSALSNEERI